MITVVLIKQVHDPNTPRASLRISADARTLQLPAGSNPILNGYDANALDEALRLREKRGGTVVAITVGGESAKDSLRRALAMGADKAIHISGPAGIQGGSDVTANLLAAAIRTVGTVG